MAPRKGFTLVELLIVITTLGLLCAMLVPSLSAARRHARVGTCAVQLHAVGAGLLAYTNESKMRMPPFAFSSAAGDIMLSGHWGGAEKKENDELSRMNVRWVNLYALCPSKLIGSVSLTCPGANMNEASFFRRTTRYSTYCLRFPYSRDLFVDAPVLGRMSGPLMGAYYMAAGGQKVFGGRDVVPLVRMDRQYLNPDTLTVFDPAKGAIAADQFEYQDFSQAASGTAFSVRRSLCHGRQFNVLMGDGSVKTATDDGTVGSVSIPQGGSLLDDGKNYSTYAERVWTFFESRR